MDTNEESRPPVPRTVSAGFLLMLGVFAVFAAVVAGVAQVLREESLFLSIVVAPGLTQLVVAIPLWIVLHRRGERAMCRGVILAAAVIFLLNAACWGLVSLSFSH